MSDSFGWYASDLSDPESFRGERGAPLSEDQKARLARNPPTPVEEPAGHVFVVLHTLAAGAGEVDVVTGPGATERELLEAAIRELTRELDLLR